MGNQGSFDKSAPKEYVTTKYLEFQAKYEDQIRESDKDLLAILNDFGTDRAGPIRLLDVGCHNGAMLCHIKQAFPGWSLAGLDLFDEVIDHCRKNEKLAGIDFQVGDVRELGATGAYELVVTNKVLHRFKDEHLSFSYASICAALIAGGKFVSFDYYHRFDQELYIVERTREHAEGLTLHAHSYEKTEKMLKEAGFSSVAFQPFQIGVDIPPSDETDLMITYPRREEGGERLNFRGSLYQPWCFLIATK